MFSDWERRILSKPVPIYWAGFESTTYKLQQAGWEFSAEQDMASMRCRIMLRHQAFRMHGCSNFVDTDFFAPQHGDHWDRLCFSIQWMTSGDVMVHRIADDFSTFKPVDMQPQILSHSEIENIEDMALFAGVPLTRTKEIVVDPATVADMMQEILKMQDPARKEYYEEQVKLAGRPGQRIDGIRPRQDFHAQIVSLAV